MKSKPHRFSRRLSVLCAGFILLAGSLSLPANAGPVYDDQDKTVTIHLENVTIDKVFEEIKSCTPYTFGFESSVLDVSETVSVNVDKAPIETVLEQILSGKDVAYEIKDDHIYIFRPQQQDTGAVNQGTYSGMVKDDNGEPIPAATLINATTGETYIAGSSGGFSISASEGDRIIVSSLGFEDTEITLSKARKFDITMRPDTELLEEVVVIGYGTVRKKDLTSSISKVSAESLQDMPAASIFNSLQGKMPGIQVSSTSGRPGSGMRIRVRGVGTINDNEPLYIVDGMPVSNIEFINPNEIESIEVLKDASSAAIYGSRAANGVVMVTTKNGDSHSGTPVIEVSAYGGLSRPVKDLEVADADEYLAFMETMNGSNSPIFKKVQEQYNKGYNTDWWKEINRQHSWVQNYDVSVSGGVKGLSYFLSAGYLDQDGIDKMSSYDKLSVRLNTEYKVKKWLTIGETFGIIRENIKGQGDSGKTGFVASAVNADPLFPVIDETKNDINPLNNYGCSELSNVKNPVAIQDRYNQGRNGVQRLSFIGNAFVQVNILDMIFVKSTFGFEIKRDDQNNFSPVYYLNVEDYNEEANTWKQFEKTDNINWLNTVNFNKIFGDHSINAIAGVQMELSNYEYLSGLKFGQPNNSWNFQWISSGVGGDETYGVGSQSALLSYFARINYSWHNRYLISASVRRDGSSNFAPDKRWGTFPSVSGAWRISEEPFFRNLNAGWIDQIKIRAGWGQLGNQRISSDAYNTYVSGGIDKEFVFNGNDPSVGYGPSNAGNPDVSWERTESVNVGLDLNLFKDRLAITADYYIKDTKGMLIQLPVSEIFGTYSPWENLGKVRNTGWELQIDYADAFRDFSWGVNFNLSSYKNKVIDLGGALPYVDSIGDVGVSGFCRTVENMPIGYFYGYVTDGIFQTPAEVAAYVNKEGDLYQPKAEPGDFRFKDVNNDGTIDDEDKTMIGSPHPDLMMGLNLNFAWKNFDLSASFSGVFGNEIFNAFKAITYQPIGYRNLCKKAIERAWTAGSGINDVPRLTNSQNNDNYRVSDFYVEDGSYFRLKNLQIGYSLARKHCEKIRLQGLRIYVSAYNLFTATSYSGLDPDVSSTNDRTNGVDIGNYPSMRTIQLGINLKF